MCPHPFQQGTPTQMTNTEAGQERRDRTRIRWGARPSAPGCGDWPSFSTEHLESVSAHATAVRAEARTRSVKPEGLGGGKAYQTTSDWLRECFSLLPTKGKCRFHKSPVSYVWKSWLMNSSSACSSGQMNDFPGYLNCVPSLWANNI